MSCSSQPNNKLSTILLITKKKQKNNSPLTTLYTVIGNSLFDGLYPNSLVSGVQGHSRSVKLKQPSHTLICLFVKICEYAVHSFVNSLVPRLQISNTVFHVKATK